MTDSASDRRVAMRRWLLTGPLAARLIVPAMSIPLACAAAVAVTGSSAGAVVGVVGVLTGVRTIRSESPDRAIRERVFDAVRTAVPSGDPNIDQVAGDRLRVAAGQGRLITALAVLLVLAIVIAPAVAAARTSAWWLLSYAMLIVLAPASDLGSFRADDQARLERFEQALPGSLA